MKPTYMAIPISAADGIGFDSYPRLIPPSARTNARITPESGERALTRIIRYCTHGSACARQSAEQAKSLGVLSRSSLSESCSLRVNESYHRGSLAYPIQPNVPNTKASITMVVNNSGLIVGITKGKPAGIFCATRWSVSKIMTDNKVRSN